MQQGSKAAKQQSSAGQITQTGKLEKHTHTHPRTGIAGQGRVLKVRVSARAAAASACSSYLNCQSSGGGCFGHSRPRCVGPICIPLWKKQFFNSNLCRDRQGADIQWAVSRLERRWLLQSPCVAFFFFNLISLEYFRSKFEEKPRFFNFDRGSASQIISDRRPSLLVASRRRFIPFCRWSAESRVQLDWAVSTRMLDPDSRPADSHTGNA